MSQDIFSPERRRTIRIKRSGLTKWKLDEIDRPAIKMAETIDEYEQAFSLAHDTYLKIGYLGAPKDHGMLFSVYSLLPETVVFVAKSYLTVISALTEIFDTPLFGLPMDDLYRAELDELRAQNRKIVEFSSLITPQNLRWRNIFMYLNQVVYQYSTHCEVNDLCIMVNPKHVRFYKEILLFEDLGPERHYHKVNAPAVALRINMDNIEDRGIDTYDKLDFDCNLRAYFHRATGHTQQGAADPEGTPPAELREQVRNGLVARHFLEKDRSLLEGLSAEQKSFLEKAFFQENVAPSTFG